MRSVPFTIDRSQWGSLIDQMTDGLRRAIRTGFYRPGDKLPPVRELVAHFGVSNRVPVAAIKQLREEGLVETATRNGCVVGVGEGDYEVGCRPWSESYHISVSSADH